MWSLLRVPLRVKARWLTLGIQCSWLPEAIQDCPRPAFILSAFLLHLRKWKEEIGEEKEKERGRREKTMQNWLCQGLRPKIGVIPNIGPKPSSMPTVVNGYKLGEWRLSITNIIGSFLQYMSCFYTNTFIQSNLWDCLWFSGSNLYTCYTILKYGLLSGF